MAYQTNLMVMSAGGYRFTDFVKAGTPLMFIILKGKCAVKENVWVLK